MDSKLTGQQRLQQVMAAPISHRWVLAACCLAASAVMLQPPIWLLDPPGQQPFGAAWNVYRLLSSLAGVATITFLLGGGVLGDLYGRRRFLLIGLVGFIVANLMLMITPVYWWFGFCRSLAMIFGSLVLPLALALINLVFYDKGRSPALAAFAVCTVLASQLSWVQGGYFGLTVGWRAAYVLPIIVAISSIAIIRSHTPETLAGHQRMIDTVVYMGWTLIVLATLYGLLMMPVAAGHWWIIVLVALGVGGLGGGFVWWWNRHTRGGRRRRRGVRTRDFAALLITGVLLNFSLIGYGMRTMSFFQVTQGRSSFGALIALAPILIGALTALYLILKAMHKHQARVVIAGGMLAMGIAMMVTALLPLEAPYLLYVIPLTLFGAGYLLAATVWMSAFLRTAIDGYYGLNAAINKAAALIGGALGAVVTGNLLATIGNATYSSMLLQQQRPADEAAKALAAFDAVLTANPNAMQIASAAAQFVQLSGYQKAYGIAYDSVLWLMAGLCFLAALIIVWGLRRSVRVEGTNEQQTAETV